MQITRRHFIQSSIGCAATLALTRSFATSANMIPIGFQLYTVRGEFARDVPQTLRMVGQIGYKGVEFWDYGGTEKVYQKYSAAELRKLLDDNGLKCCGMHVKLEALSDDKLEHTIANSHTLGNEYVNLVMAPEKMKSNQGIHELAALLNSVAGRLRTEKLVAGYHCHGFDFAEVEGRVAWEILFQLLSPEVNMQLDVGNCLSGGGDPVAMLKEFPGRTRTIHIKEREEKTFDNPFYQEVFKLCETTSGTRWYIVEMGSSDGTGFEVPKQALAKLRRLGKGTGG